MKFTEIILAIAAWCGQNTSAGVGINKYTNYSKQGLEYSQRLNADIAQCKKEILSCIRPLKSSQADEVINCFSKVDLPK